MMYLPQVGRLENALFADFLRETRESTGRLTHAAMLYAICRAGESSGTSEAFGYLCQVGRLVGVILEDWSRLVNIGDILRSTDWDQLPVGRAKVPGRSLESLEADLYDAAIHYSKGADADVLEAAANAYGRSILAAKGRITL